MGLEAKGKVSDLNKEVNDLKSGVADTTREFDNMNKELQEAEERVRRLKAEMNSLKQGMLIEPSNRIPTLNSATEGIMDSIFESMKATIGNQFEAVRQHLSQYYKPEEIEEYLGTYKEIYAGHNNSYRESMLPGKQNIIKVQYQMMDKLNYDAQKELATPTYPQSLFDNLGETVDNEISAHKRYRELKKDLASNERILKAEQDKQALQRKLEEERRLTEILEAQAQEAKSVEAEIKQLKERQARATETTKSVEAEIKKESRRPRKKNVSTTAQDIASGRVDSSNVFTATDAVRTDKFVDPMKRYEVPDINLNFKIPPPDPDMEKLHYLQSLMMNGEISYSQMNDLFNQPSYRIDREINKARQQHKADGQIEILSQLKRGGEYIYDRDYLRTKKFTDLDELMELHSKDIKTLERANKLAKYSEESKRYSQPVSEPQITRHEMIRQQLHDSRMKKLEDMASEAVKYDIARYEILSGAGIKLKNDKDLYETMMSPEYDKYIEEFAFLENKYRDYTGTAPTNDTNLLDLRDFAEVIELEKAQASELYKKVNKAPPSQMPNSATEIEDISRKLLSTGLVNILSQVKADKEVLRDHNVENFKRQRSESSKDIERMVRILNESGVLTKKGKPFHRFNSSTEIYDAFETLANPDIVESRYTPSKLASESAKTFQKFEDEVREVIRRAGVDMPDRVENGDFLDLSKWYNSNSMNKRLKKYKKEYNSEVLAEFRKKILGDTLLLENKMPYNTYLGPEVQYGEPKTRKGAHKSADAFEEHMNVRAYYYQEGLNEFRKKLIGNQDIPLLENKLPSNTYLGPEVEYGGRTLDEETLKRAKADQKQYEAYYKQLEKIKYSRKYLDEVFGEGFSQRFSDDEVTRYANRDFVNNYQRAYEQAREYDNRLNNIRDSRRYLDEVFGEGFSNRFSDDEVSRYANSDFVNNYQRAYEQARQYDHMRNTVHEAYGGRYDNVDDDTMREHYNRVNRYANRYADYDNDQMARRYADSQIPLQRHLLGLIDGTNSEGTKFINSLNRMTSTMIHSVELIERAFMYLNRFTMMSDAFVSTNSRVSFTNDKMQTGLSDGDAVKLVMDAARESRVKYTEFADSYSKYGITGAFDSNDELIDFVSTLNAMARLSGSHGTELSGMNIQMAQSLSLGHAQMQELNSILEANKLLRPYIAQAAGIEEGKIKDAASNRQITVDVLKKAVELAGEDGVVDKFQGMDMLFSDYTNRMYNAVGNFITNDDRGKALTDGLKDKFEKMSNFMESEKGYELMDRLGKVGLRLIDTVSAVVEKSAPILDFFTKSPDLLANLIIGITALNTTISVGTAAYTAYKAGRAMWDFASPVVSSAMGTLFGTGATTGAIALLGSSTEASFASRAMRFFGDKMDDIANSGVAKAFKHAYNGGINQRGVSVAEDLADTLGDFMRGTPSNFMRGALDLLSPKNILGLSLALKSFNMADIMVDNYSEIENAQAYGGKSAKQFMEMGYDKKTAEELQDLYAKRNESIVGIDYYNYKPVEMLKGKAWLRATSSPTLESFNKYTASLAETEARIKELRNMEGDDYTLRTLENIEKNTKETAENTKQSDFVKELQLEMRKAGQVKSALSMTPAPVTININGANMTNDDVADVIVSRLRMEREIATAF